MRWVGEGKDTKEGGYKGRYTQAKGGLLRRGKKVMKY